MFSELGEGGGGAGSDVSKDPDRKDEGLCWSKFHVWNLVHSRGAFVTEAVQKKICTLGEIGDSQQKWCLVIFIVTCLSLKDK